MNRHEEFCPRCDGCGWYEGGATIQTPCEMCHGTGVVVRNTHPRPATVTVTVDVHWLRKIEALRPGDACEFHYPARKEWRRGTVKVNGGSSYWTVVDEAEQKLVSCIYIEQVRLPGQVEAWAHD